MSFIAFIWHYLVMITYCVGTQYQTFLIHLMIYWIITLSQIRSFSIDINENSLRTIHNTGLCLTSITDATPTSYLGEVVWSDSRDREYLGRAYRWETLVPNLSQECRISGGLPLLYPSRIFCRITLDTVGSCDVTVERSNFLEVLDCLVRGVGAAVDLLPASLLMGVASLSTIRLTSLCGRDL